MAEYLDAAGHGQEAEGPLFRRIRAPKARQPASALTPGSVYSDVVVLYSGPQALDMAMQFRPDVVFLDIGMPGMDGNQTALAMRQVAGLETMLLIALTGWGTKADRERSARSGFDYHLTKLATLEAIDALLVKIAGALH